MTNIGTLEIKQKFYAIEDLYRYLLKNVDFIGQLIDIKIQKPLKAKPFCIIGREKITERNILFFASNRDFPENLGELIFMSGIFNADIIIFFIKNLHKAHLESLNWLQKICNNDTMLIFIEANF